jgi:hypothetical protein
MPGRKAKPPRLWFRDDDKAWIILDRGRQIRTGCGRDDIDGAAKALETYIGGRHTTTIGATDPGVLAIADVLTAYETSKRPKDKTDERAWGQHDLLLIRLLDLNNFFGDRTVSAIKAQLCRDFVDWSTGAPNENNRQAGIKPREGKVSDQTARRRLADLRAAINRSRGYPGVGTPYRVFDRRFSVGCGKAQPPIPTLADGCHFEVESLLQNQTPR